MSNYKKTNPSICLKILFIELVKLDTMNTGRRDWALLKWKSLAPFNQFTLVSLFNLNKSTINGYE